MLISEKKTKSMIVNFTKNHQFHTRLRLNDKNIEIVQKMKILGTIFTDNFSWDENCAAIIKKVNARMQLLTKIWSFGSTNEEMVHLWKVYCLSILEQSCVVWGSSLTLENKNDLERLQKTFCKLVLEEDFSTYNEALLTLGLQKLTERRQKLTLDFAKRSISDDILRDLFLLKKKRHEMATRNTEKYRVNHANTNRYKNSPIPTMQNMLNKE